MRNGQESLTASQRPNALPVWCCLLGFHLSSSGYCLGMAVSIPHRLPELRAKGASDAFEVLEVHDHDTRSSHAARVHWTGVGCLQFRVSCAEIAAYTSIREFP